MSEYVKKAITAALAARASTDLDAAQQAMADFNEKQADWYAFCPICQEKVTGTLAELREHGRGHTKAKS